ncbi:hypothetical protein ALC57_11333 [Trachymyrmex cornetzi]|uniref:Uncharacterized protein n=1 Tax=Trachymyrmex cornetzi TaxID=471704 RepID=A0A195DUA6_9HYME|nr:hypothetical protein ALC57_11333 [Trachymyrmex cornetzi]
MIKISTCLENFTDGGSPKPIAKYHRNALHTLIALLEVRIVSLAESKENRYSCAFQDFHGIAIHDDQYEVFSRHPGAPGRHAGFVRTTIGVSNCENRILEFMLASITLNIVANVFHKFEDDTHMRIDRPGLLRRTVNVGGGLSTRKYNRRSCTVDQASLFDTEIAYYFVHIGQYVDHHDVVIDVTGSVKNYLIDYREWYLST